MDVEVAMKAVNPKFVPREWQLVEAYNQAQQGEFSAAQKLHEVTVFESVRCIINRAEICLGAEEAVR